MSAGSPIMMAISQWRNALISSILNKAQPFEAIMALDCMVNCIPPDVRPKKEHLRTTKKPELKTWFEDPDSAEYQEQAWKYVREYAPIVEDKISEFITSSKESMRIE